MQFQRCPLGRSPIPRLESNLQTPPSCARAVQAQGKRTFVGCHHGPHAGDPHYEPKERGSAQVREGDLLLLDIWGKTLAPNSVYYDITWTGYLGARVPKKYAEIFRLVRDTREAAVDFVRNGVKAGRLSRAGRWIARRAKVIRKAGFANISCIVPYNIGQEVHGNGANMDGLETRDVRRIIPRTCFSVRPGNLSARVRSAQRSGCIRGGRPCRCNRRGADRKIAGSV